MLTMNRFLAIAFLAACELLAPPVFPAAAVVPSPCSLQVSPDATSREIFDHVQDGLTSGDIGAFSRYFSSQVMVTLKGAESGHYSANQAYYLLTNYIRTRQFARFVFTTVGGSEGNPYATGSATFNYRGKRETAQVYVSLAQTGGRWLITQINIY
jgi:hypothetical protein